MRSTGFKLSLLFGVIHLAACSKTGYQARKTQLLSTANIIQGAAENSNAGEFNGQISQPGDSSGSIGQYPNPPTPRNPSNEPTTLNQSVNTPVGWICTNEGTARKGTNLALSRTVTVDILNSSGSKVCTLTDPSIRSSLLTKKLSFSLATCPNLSDGSYKLKIMADGKLISDAHDATFDAYMVLLAEPQSAALTPAAQDGVMVIKGSVVTSVSKNIFVLSAPSGGYGCDFAASPLVLQIPRNGEIEPISLSAPADGIFFDILGENSDPFPYTKKLISWLLEGSRRTNYFLALPDAYGQILGIDQLFGNNTKGPDGAFARNGYEALRKYDLNNDGFIDSQDPVYNTLRLWADENGDGVADGHEVFTLNDRGVASIDLEYDNHYSETDPYGNKVTLKSVFTMTDGSLNLMYDLWFAL